MNIMRTVIDTPQSPAHDSLIDKKSEFIANACHVSDLDEAMLFVQSVRMQHPKARHVLMLLYVEIKMDAYLKE